MASADGPSPQHAPIGPNGPAAFGDWACARVRNPRVGLEVRDFTRVCVAPVLDRGRLSAVRTTGRAPLRGSRRGEQCSLLRSRVQRSREDQPRLGKAGARVLVKWPHRECWQDTIEQTNCGEESAWQEPIGDAFRRQQEFVADASHELRTPFPILRTALDLLAQSPNRTVAERADLVGDARREATPSPLVSGPPHGRRAADSRDAAAASGLSARSSYHVRRPARAPLPLRHAADPRRPGAAVTTRWKSLVR